MTKVILQGHIIVPDTDIEAVKLELINHITLTKQEEGCLVFNVTQDSEDSGKFNVYEEFKDRQSFASHQERVGNSKWGAIAVNVERHYEITDET
ncbi:MAG: autoinducer 2-degrading protein [Parasphingorhabdus sp.]|jgi:autoinducer 2-degrading protein